MPFFGRSYTPPHIPVTPSKRINEVLQARCNKYFHSSIKYVLAQFVCVMLSLGVRVYSALSEDSKPSRIRWMVACSLVGAVVGVFTWYAVVFNALYYLWIYITGPVGSYLFYNLCDYGCLIFGTLGVFLMGVSIVAY